MSTIRSLYNKYTKYIWTTILALTFLTVSGYFYYQSGFSYELIFNDKQLAYIKKTETYDQVLETITSENKATYGEDAYFLAEASFNRVRVDKDLLVDEQVLSRKIKNVIEIKKPASVIMVDDEEVISVPSEAVAKKVFEEILAYYRNLDDVIDVSFKQDIKIVDKDVLVEKILPEDMAFFLFDNFDKNQKSLTLKDNNYRNYLQEVATINSIEYADNKNVKTMLTGEEIFVNFKQSLIDILITKEVIEQETIPFDEELKADPNMYVGQQRVAKAGKVGEKSITYHVYYQNNDEVKREEVSEEVISEPENKVIYVGSKERPAVVLSEYSSDKGSAIVAEARKYLGTPYVWGGSSPAGFDCSGFTKYVYQRVLGVNLAHSSAGQASSGTPVSRANLQPGDLIIMSGHVGIYIGNGSMIHAPVPGRSVEITSINTAWANSVYIGARRLY